jgi:UDP-N-acetylmuramoylalanine--D-glutamate ligase
MASTLPDTGTGPQNTNLVILGGGESGYGAALLGKAKGFSVFLSDKGKLADKYRQLLGENGIDFEEETHSEERILAAGLIIKSPGIPDKVALVQKAREKGIPVISEIEFAARYTKARLIGITGSNGKTTTTLLTYHLLKNAGLSVGLGGNVGESFAKQVIADPFDYYVLELSSFQLDNSYDFNPHIAVLLNITPDHLDRYDYTFGKYVDSKFRILQNQTSEDFFIYYADNEPIMQQLHRRQLIPIGLPITTEFPPGLIGKPNISYLKDDVITVNFEYGHQPSLRIPMADMTIGGKHNAINAMAATLVCRVLNVPEEKIREGLRTFKNAPHRLEPAGEMDGVRFVNDSKATNVDSVYYALGSFKEPLVLIAGGVDKGNDYDQIDALVREKVKALICLGKDNTKLQAYFAGKVPVIRQTQDIREAVRMGLELGRPGDVVLLSPACASFDLFRNYEDRGAQFKAAVQQLMKG